MAKIKGIDVSYHQGKIDWQAVANDGVRFAVLRDGYRRALDAAFLANAKGASAAGITVMAYHFIYTDSGVTPGENAKAAVNNIRQAGLDPAHVVVWADLEYDTWHKNGETCTRERCTAYTQAFLDELAAQGVRRMGIYCNRDYYAHYYTEDIKSRYPIWLADYEGEPEYPCVMQQTGSTGRVAGINGNVDMDLLFDESYLDDNREDGNNMGVTAQDVLDVMRGWIGYNEADNSYINILNVYNSHKPLARGYAIKPGDSWCDATVSAAAIQAGAVDLIGTEVGVERHVDIFKSKGIWLEDGAITPLPGDIIVFNWDDKTQPNDGYSDHIGYVESVSGGVITAIEGNTSDSVARRKYNVGYGCIRGFARPQYANNSSHVPDNDGSHSGANKPANAVKVGDIVRVRAGASSYTGGGVASFIYANTYRVDQVDGDRAVLDAKGICTPFNVQDLIIVTEDTESKPAGGTVAVGAIVRVRDGARTYTGGGVADWVYAKTYRVDQLDGDRAVLDTKGLCTPFRTCDLVVVTGGAQSKPVAVGSMVRVRNGARTYTGGGVASWVYSKTYRVDQLNGDRAVLDAKGLCTPFKVQDLIVQ